MEELLLLVLQFLGDLLVQFVLEVVWEFGVSAYKATFERPNRTVGVAALGYFFLGAAIGGLSLLVRATRLLKPGPFPGISLVVAPICVGLAMHGWGTYRRSRGRVTSQLSTFAGGAAFAFGTALVRFLCAG